MSADRAWERNLRLLWAGQFLTTAGLTVVVPLLPFYLEELGMAEQAANRFWSGLALAAPAVTLMLAGPLWGRLGDRWGRKWMVVRALLGLAASMILMGLARTPLQFLLCRLLQGASGGVVDAAAAFAGAEAPPARRGRALGSLQGASAAGSLVGPLAGGLLTDLWGLRPLLLATGVLTAACSLLAARALRESARPAPPASAPPPLARTVAGLLRRPRVRALVLAGVCAQAGAYGLVTVFAPHVRSLLPDPGRAASWTGLLQAATWGATVLGSAWWGRRNDRRPVEANFAAAACGCAISIALQALPGQAGWLFPLRLLQGFCFSALAQSVFLQVSRQAAGEHQGLHMGAANSFLTLGQILGSLAGALLAGLLPPAPVFALTGSAFGVAAALVWHASREHGGQGAAPVPREG